MYTIYGKTRQVRTLRFGYVFVQGAIKLLNYNKQKLETMYFNMAKQIKLVRTTNKQQLGKRMTTTYVRFFAVN